MSEAHPEEQAAPVGDSAPAAETRPAAGEVPPAETAYGDAAARGVGRQSLAVALVITALSLGVLLWPRGGDVTAAAPGGFLLDATGRAATLGSRLAPVTLVHFWATWCPPCIEESPALDRLNHDLAGRREFGLLRVAVADSPARVATFLGQGAATVLYDPQWDVAHRYGTDQLPETYLVVHGRIVEKFIGEVNWDDPAVRQKIDSRLSADDGNGRMTS
jgi:thiol-disulfide isomerase/thioredoxin